jgi:glycerol-3-phosphate acyltransferase PlsY
MNIAFGCLLSYLLGAIPTAYLVGRAIKGIDIRQHGSGNVGATNTFRVLGAGPGIFVLVCDILKGVLAVVVVSRILAVDALTAWIFFGLVAIIGHNWTVFLNFSGGKGIATSLGVLIGLTVQVPSFGPVLLVTLGVWVVIFVIFGFVSLASVTAAVALPVAAAVTAQPLPLVLLGVLCCLFIVIRHRSNIRRLVLGQESRVSLFGRSRPKD